jgi:uncharacterized protein YndB with AHSA1/START domain
VEKTEAPPIVVETIEIGAPAGAVFAALTEPSELVQWWGSDDGYRVEKMERELTPGGAWKITGTGRDGLPFSVGGVYRIVDPPRLVEFTWRHDWHDGDDPLGDTIVRYELQEKDKVTQLRVTHSGFTDAGDREDHAEGWPVVLGWLRAFVTRNIDRSREEQR